MKGLSGSGKTHFITSAIKLLKQRFNYQIAVIKNIHEHEIDEKGKDSYKYSEAGAVYSITKNIHDETTIFFKKKMDMEELIDWLELCPYEIDLVFIEGFKNLNYPTILCIKEFTEIENQIENNVKMIAGLACTRPFLEPHDLKVPIVNIEKDFEKFLTIFNIK